MTQCGVPYDMVKAHRDYAILVSTRRKDQMTYLVIVFIYYDGL